MNRIVIAALLLAAAPAHAEDFFQGYQSISVPRSDIPIGAKWWSGVGPNGPGTTAENIDVSSGAANYKINKDLQGKIGFSLATFLGLDSDTSRKVKAELEGITVYRVKNVSSIAGLVAGDQLLFEGIKAKKITLSTDASIGGSLSSSAKARGFPVSISMSGSDTAHVELDGSDLFLAYRVIELGQARTSSKEYRHNGRELLIDGTHHFKFCDCATTPEHIEVIYENLKMVGLDGIPAHTKFEHDPRTGSFNQYRIQTWNRGNIITGLSFSLRYRKDKSCSDIASTADGQPLCFVSFPKEANKLTLYTTEFRLDPVKKPKGTY
jgi:hypothetical protein